MENIICQGCTEEQRKSEYYSGCSTCGGFGMVFVVNTCNGCGKEYLVRPDPTTIYEGKRFISVDGMKLVCTLKGAICKDCYEKINE